VALSFDFDTADSSAPEAWRLVAVGTAHCYTHLLVESNGVVQVRPKNSLENWVVDLADNPLSQSVGRRLEVHHTPNKVDRSSSELVDVGRFGRATMSA